jgi:hypothetical protein
MKSAVAGTTSLADEALPTSAAPILRGNRLESFENRQIWLRAIDRNAPSHRDHFSCRVHFVIRARRGRRSRRARSNQSP